MPLSPEALESNRRGELTSKQHGGLAGPLRQRNFRALSVAGALFALALLVGVFAASSLSALWRIGILVVALGIAVSLILRVYTGADRALSRDLAHKRVEVVTGPITKEEASAMDLNSTSVYILRVGDQRFTVTQGTFESAPRGGQVSVYYLPASLEVVNLEIVTEGSPVSASRPLVEAIVGSWRNQLAKATFSADGSVTASVMGRHSAGQWSVDSDGLLHAEIAGRNEIAQASISDDELCITLAGRVFTLSREG